MKQAIKHGTQIDTLTPREAREIVGQLAERNQPKRVRAAETIKLDANGFGQDEVYVVPPGWEFETRRVTLDLDTAISPNAGNVPLNVVGASVEYLRSGTRIEYAVPSSPNAVPQVPGVQTWGAEQGPYLRNGEAFEVRVRGMTANAILTVQVEGILRRPVSDSR